MNLSIKSFYKISQSRITPFGEGLSSQQAEQMEEVEEQVFDYGWNADRESILDDAAQSGAAGVLLEDNQGKVKGYLYGYTLDYNDELKYMSDNDILQILECFSDECSSNSKEFIKFVRKIAKAGNIFYVSNFAVSRGGFRFKVHQMLTDFLSIVKEKNIQYLAFDALSDTQKLLMKNDIPNAEREQKYGIKVLCVLDFSKIEYGQGTKLFLVKVIK